MMTLTEKGLQIAPECNLYRSIHIVLRMCMCYVCVCATSVSCHTYLVAVLPETVLSEGQRNNTIGCFNRDRGTS